jgi:thiol-disulfide isomerase/thioredoxin
MLRTRSIFSVGGVLLLLASLLNPVHILAADITRFDPKGSEFGQFRGQGKWLVVKIWLSSCHICNREAHNYVDYYEFHAGERVTVVGISLDGDNQADALAFIDRHSVSYPNFIIDFQTGAGWFTSLTGESFAGTPGFLIFGSKGELRAQQIGAVPTDVIDRFIEANS